jgi:hypothetical protein
MITAMRSALDVESLVQLATSMFGPLREIELPESGEMRAGIGSYAATFPAPAWQAQRMFMATVAALAPQAMDDLRRRLRQHIDRHADYFEPGQKMSRDEWREWVTRLHRWAASGVEPEPLQHRPSDLDQDLLDLMNEWTATWHLGDAHHIQFFQIASFDEFTSSESGPLLHLYLAMARPEFDEWIRPGLLSDEPEMWSPIFPAFEPTLEHRTDYAARARIAFERQLTAMLDETCEIAEESGLRATATKRNGTLHFRWLVRYQVLEESISSIAQSESVAYKTVSEALNRTAEAIDLPLRPPSRGGRKPGPARTTRKNPSG